MSGGEDAFVGNFKLRMGDAGSPEQFANLCEVFDVGGVGETSEQVQSTTFCNDGSHVYIPGLADGNEVTFSSNITLDEDGSLDTDAVALIQAIKAKESRNFQAVFDKNSPVVGFQFTLALLSWELVPSVTDKNTINFTGKISGAVEII